VPQRKQRIEKTISWRIPFLGFVTCTSFVCHTGMVLSEDGIRSSHLLFRTSRALDCLGVSGKGRSSVYSIAEMPAKAVHTVRSQAE